jgi:NADH dehydrogenase (ubiquinone) 1 alpha subcomplex subunit 9
MEVNLVSVPVSAAKAFGKAMEYTNAPAVTEDGVEQMLEDNVARTDPNLLTFKDLDISPVSVDKVAFDYLARFRAGGHFRLVEGYH